MLIGTPTLPVRNSDIKLVFAPAKACYTCTVIGAQILPDPAIGDALAFENAVIANNTTVYFFDACLFQSGNHGIQYNTFFG
jgi:hypothetical protein